MARLTGPAGHYILRSVGYLIAGNRKFGRTCTIRVSDEAVPELIDLGFTLIETEAEESSPPEPQPAPTGPAPTRGRKPRAAKYIMTTQDFSPVDREEIREETR